ncbi:MAG: hypothetical protein NWQ05_07320 [Burkholderiaceae bacterium]|jgi:hypothetical protein|nr:hypothetical protein [Burkholderiaceae bacterium]
MASKEPSLIRSTKAFSVEIPEGSSSAKAKISDIVAGDLGELGQSDSHFEELLAQNALKQTSDNESVDTQQAFAADQVKADVYAHAQENASHETMAGISPDHLHSPTGIGVATESHKDHLVGVAEEHDQDHVMGIGNDPSNEHLLAISNEGLHDTHVALPTDKVEDHHASIAQDKYEDHHVAVAAAEPAAPIPLFVSSNDDFPDDHMEIEAPPEEALHTQALTDEDLVDHIEHVKEGSAKLAEAHLSADIPAPLLTPQVKPVAQLKQPQLVKKAPAVLTPEMVKQQQEALLAKQHKMEEFHGRVDAIRKTVNDINSKLDHISPQEKKPH